MSDKEMHKTGLSPGKPASARAENSRRGRRQVIGVVGAGLSIAVAAIVSLEFGTAPSRVVENSATPAPSNATASIFIHPTRGACRSRTFDNRTGQISEASIPCSDAAVDAKEASVPSGTMHTLNSISRSFK
jgi:hypothetical protein